MSLQQWLDNSWITRIERSAADVANLMAIAEREIADASLDGISTDGRFSHAYDAVRSLSELALHASGFTVPKGLRQHERSIDSLRFTLDADWTAEVDFLDRCRRLRNMSLYDRAGVIQQEDADELLAASRRLLAAVRDWLKSHHPDLLRL